MAAAHVFMTRSCDIILMCGAVRQLCVVSCARSCMPPCVAKKMFRDYTDETHPQELEIRVM